jgi:hypothetical protein
MRNDSGFERLSLEDTGRYQRIIIKAPRRWNLLFALAFVFIFTGGLFFVTHLVATQNEDNSLTTVVVVQALASVVFIVMVFGIIYEFFKKEVIDLSAVEITIRHKFFNRISRGTSYELKSLKDPGFAEAVERGWELVTDYEDAWRKKKECQWNSGKNYPVLKFLYNGEEVKFANSVSQKEGEFILRKISIGS